MSDPRRLLLALVVGLMVQGRWLPSVRAEDRPAAEILAEIKALPQPKLSGNDREDAERVKAYRTATRAAQLRKRQLIGELLQADPGNPELPALVQSRWRTNLTAPGQYEATKAEVAAIVARNEHPNLLVEAYDFQTWVAIGLLHPDYPFDKMNAAVRAFTDRYPQDPRCATLLSQLSNSVTDPAAKAELLRSIERDYPDTREAKLLVAQRLNEARLGKPFNLEFTDATSGMAVSMKQLKGKVVVIDFWATWCVPCVEEMPRMKELYAEYRDKGVEFIGISLDLPQKQGGLDRLKTYVGKNQIDWPQYYQGNGWESEFSTFWGVDSIPAMFLIDSNGNVASLDARDDLEGLLIKYRVGVTKSP